MSKYQKCLQQKPSERLPVPKLFVKQVLTKFNQNINLEQGELVRVKSY